MIQLKDITDGMSKSFFRHYSHLYAESKVFRNVANFFGISLGSSAAYTFFSTCPCCGRPALLCPIGIGAGLVVGFFLGSIVYIGKGLKIAYSYFFRRGENGQEKKHTAKRNHPKRT